jgi:glycosyltransferase involved in cell wall biosynthesis
VWISSVEEFAVAVERLRRDPDLRRRLGTSGRHYVERRYSWDAVLTRMEDALRSLVLVSA